MTQVFFCSPSTKPLSFRSPVETDYAGSHLRARIFGSLQEREVDMKLIRGDTENGDNFVLNDTSNRLMDWQKSDALEHWRSTWFLSFFVGSLLKSIAQSCGMCFQKHSGRPIEN